MVLNNAVSGRTLGLFVDKSEEKEVTSLRNLQNLRKKRFHLFALSAMIPLVMLGILQTALAGDRVGESINGTYELHVVTDAGATYDTQIGIEDLGNGMIEISTEYSHIPIVLVGEIQGDLSAPDGIISSFNAAIPKLFDGSATASIQKKNGSFELQGKGSGVYSFGDSSGQGSGTAKGRKISTELQMPGALSALSAISDNLEFLASSQKFPTPSPVDAAKAAAVAIISAITAGSVAMINRRSHGLTGSNAQNKSIAM